jgi:hypothetical protein
MISGLNSKGHEERCAELGLQTLEERRYEQDMAMVHKFSTGVGNLAHEKLFQKIPERAVPVTRLAGPGLNFTVPAARLDIRKNSFAVRSVQKFNTLPVTIKEIPASANFKKALRKH